SVGEELGQFKVLFVGLKLGWKNLNLIQRAMSDFAIHPMASIIGETGPSLSRMRSTANGRASEARVLDKLGPLAMLAAMR
ncbi:MAG: hypothetical protein HYZ60_02080, partial [Methylocystis sp.]|nr:hypothetical protein [Methylocystis sp.]